MRRLVGTGAAIILLVILAIGGVAAPASAHILPTTTVALDVHEATVDATLSIPVSDLDLATSLDIDTSSTMVDEADAVTIRDYIATNLGVTSSDGAWTVVATDLSIGDNQQYGTAVFPVLTATVALTPPSTSVPRQFELQYDVVLEKVVTHTAIVSVRSDWSAGQVESVREVGTIQQDTATGTIPPLAIDLGDGSEWQGLTGMVALGMSHILEGTDHQLFLLTLLLPAPLLVARRRWAGPVPATRAVRRIAAITLSFTIGHSITLALGALGLPVPQQLVEALIAVSILVAAAHAIRPIFPGREALVAGAFGLIHGMAFSATLSALDLSGSQLVLSLLGFNLGIELMQLVIVTLVLPPLCVLARTLAYRPLRVVASALTAIAAAAWLFARLGMPNLVADTADGFVGIALWVVGALWLAAIVAIVAAVGQWRSRRPGRPEPTGILAVPDARTPAR